MQSVLPTSAPSQYRSPAQVPPPHLTALQIRPTCPTQTPISPAHMLSSQLSPSMCRWLKQQDLRHNQGDERAGREQPECFWAASPCAGTAASQPPPPCSSCLLATQASPGETELRSHFPTLDRQRGRSRCGSPLWGLRGRQRLQMGTCGCMSASRAPAPGSPCWRLCGFSVLCPSPPCTACRIQGLCKWPPHFPPASTAALGGPGQGEPRRLRSPGACPHPGWARAASA